MKLISILQRILILKDTAYIPGLGTFTAQYKTAQFDKNKNSFIPPTKEITFDTNLNSNDINVNEALIANGLTPEEISKEIADFVEEVKELKNNERLEIEGLGYFTKTNDNLQFICNSEKSLDIDNLGFEKIPLINNVHTPIKEEKIPEKKEEKVQDKKEDKVSNNKEIIIPEVKKEKESEKNEKKEIIIKTNSDITPKTKTKINPIFIIAPIIIILVVLSIIFHKPIMVSFNKLFKSKDTTQNITKNNNVIQKNNQDNNDVSLGNNEEYKKLLNAKIKNTADVYLGNNFKLFYIVVSSFSNKENAENFAQQLRQKGFNPEILDGNNYFRVTIGGYDGADALIQDYNHLKNKFGKEIWILINKQ